MEPTSLQNPDLSLVLSSCEPELQELMKQIDIMISQQKRQWEADMQAVERQLKSGQDELLAARSLLERRNIEIGVLRKQLEDVQTGPQKLETNYEQQLQKLREELDKLKKSYSKLQRKHMKEAAGGSNIKEADLSEVIRLNEKIQEYQQRTLDWERQSIQQKNQLKALEVQNKSLTEELIHVNSQRASRQQERHRDCCTEAQRLRAQLEKAQHTLHSQELELERLRPVEMWLGKQALSADKEGPHTSQEAQRKSSADHQRLRNETARLNQMLQAKDQVIRSLEGCLSAQGCTGVETLRKDLEKTAAKLHSARVCEVHLKDEVARLKERLEKTNWLRAEHSKMELELGNIRAKYDSLLSEEKKLREALQRAQQTHSGEVEGMRKEVSKLTAQLHQRDLGMGTLGGPACGVEQRLLRETERADQKAAELKMTQTQLVALQDENQRVKSVLQRLEAPSPKGGQSSVVSLGERESFASSLSGLERQNQQLSQELAEVRRQLQLSRQQPTQNGYEQALLSRAADDQHSHQGSEDGSIDETWSARVKMQEIATSQEGDIQRLFKQLQSPAQSAPCSPSSSKRHSRSQAGPPPLPAARQRAAEGRSSSSEESHTAGSSPSPLELRSVSPADAMVSRFLEEESLRSKELLQKLDSHIQDMRESTVRTVSKHLRDSAETAATATATAATAAPAPIPAQTANTHNDPGLRQTE